MKKVLLIVFFTITIHKVYSQVQTNIQYQTGITAEQNLRAIGNLSPYSAGGIGFDTRYEGIKGSPRLFDTLQSSRLYVKGQDYCFKLECNIDAIQNSVIFRDSKTGQFFSVPSDIIKEIKINQGGKELVFRTTKGKNFEKDIKEDKFYQVLKDGQFQFIKIPIKKFVEADFKGGYSADRRYDEYTTFYRYYIMSSDSTFHPIQLSKKSLIKMFPDKKEIIINAFGSKSGNNDEEMVLDVLEKFR